MKAQTVYKPQQRKMAGQDDAVMATNNSSIVSKRSVERLYYPEPHFYRYFVKKPLRRSPLINRGYWLRMYAVEKVIQNFLHGPEQKEKIVVNLGCGYDPLAFQWLSKLGPQARRARFIDVDFPELMAKKADLILQTPQLYDLLGDRQMSPKSKEIYIQTEHYSGLGCDIANIEKLEELLASHLDSSDSMILFTAEVSITYMDHRLADHLIRWAAKYHETQFCLLEQYLPDGSGHPFAEKMAQHFSNLQTPLKAIHTYPQLHDQERRFLKAGWMTAHARSLWDIWNDPAFIANTQKTALNEVEPFDEWEEFVLFASHYFLLVAQNTQQAPSSLSLQCSPAQDYPALTVTYQPLRSYSKLIPKSKVRKFGALFPLSPDTVGYCGGLGLKTRLGNTEIYSSAADNVLDLPSIGDLPSRMCHTATPLDRGLVLVGGRNSPDAALRDCWMISRDCWRRIEDLPMPLFRHCAAKVNLSEDPQPLQGLLVYGGKTGGVDVSDAWLLWREGTGWDQINKDSFSLRPRFGAVMISTGLRKGIMLGGMEADGTILHDIWEWSLHEDEMVSNVVLEKDRENVNKDYSYTIRLAPCKMHPNLHGRFGASLVQSAIGLLIIGGVSDRVIPQALDIIHLTKKKSNDLYSLQRVYLSSYTLSPRPLLVGHSAISLQDQVLILGGGAVCFSFGSHWNSILINLCQDGQKPLPDLEAITERMKMPLRINAANPVTVQTQKMAFDHISPTVTVNRQVVGSIEDFKTILDQGRPVVICGADLGTCTNIWTLADLRTKVGDERDVIVHEANTSFMDFQSKNFRYVKKSFKTFIDEIAGGSKQYLRSLALNSPAEKPANISSDFPELAPDFKLPDQLEYVIQNLHSSVLRISGGVNMWLHYDVMANVLCQVKGRKRLILFPPSDVSLFSIPPGTSTSSINCFESDLTGYPALGTAHGHEAFLEPGDILLIPPLWLHSASPMEDVSVSVNVFFRNLDSGYATGRDVYGNRDLQAYEKGRKDVEKMTRSFDRLPSYMRRFYLERLADELRSKAQELPA